MLRRYTHSNKINNRANFSTKYKDFYKKYLIKDVEPKIKNNSRNPKKNHEYSRIKRFYKYINENTLIGNKSDDVHFDDYLLLNCLDDICWMIIWMIVILFLFTLFYHIYEYAFGINKWGRDHYDPLVIFYKFCLSIMLIVATGLSTKYVGLKIIQIIIRMSIKKLLGLITLFTIAGYMSIKPWSKSGGY